MRGRAKNKEPGIKTKIAAVMYFSLTALKMQNTFLAPGS
jgi:hypothetical protein